MPRAGERGELLRRALVLLLVLVYVGLALYFHLVLHTSTIYVHFAYVPTVLAATWWGWRGLVVAAAQAAVILALRAFGIGAGEPWNDLVRVAFLLLVGSAVAFLAERHRRARREAEASREDYRTLFDRSLAGIFVYRGETIVLANTLMGEMMRCPPEELVGRSFWECIHPDGVPVVRELLEKRATGEQVNLHYEAKLVRRDGTALWGDIASSPVSLDGHDAVLVNIYDVTARREEARRRRELSELARQQEEQLVHSTRLAELGEMAAAVAHELNQPLSGIRTFASNTAYMLENDVGEPGEVKGNLRRITEQVDRASRIIGQMRQLARRSEHALAPVDLNAIVAESVEFLSTQLRLAGVEVDLDLDRELPLVQGDRIRLEQVVLNLVTNARQAMNESPTRRLRVSTSRSELDGRSSVSLSVSDTGKGFPPEMARRIFAPFYTTKKPGQGTGLGLSISLNIVKEHDGTIEAVGRPDEGATFTLTLPVEPPRSDDPEEGHHVE